MESIKKLREIDIFAGLRTIIKDQINEIAAEIECEIAERYMELPLDADGVPIHVGDLVRLNDGGEDSYIDGFTSELCDGEGELMPTIDATQYRACDMRHVVERTIEDVLRELADIPTAYERTEAIAKYADEIRGLL